MGVEVEEMQIWPSYKLALWEFQVVGDRRQQMNREAALRKNLKLTNWVDRSSYVLLGYLTQALKVRLPVFHQHTIFFSI